LHPLAERNTVSRPPRSWGGLLTVEPHDSDAWPLQTAGARRLTQRGNPSAEADPCWCGLWKGAGTVVGRRVPSAVAAGAGVSALAGRTEIGIGIEGHRRGAKVIPDGWPGIALCCAGASGRAR
jgi:hypothetical protein